MLEFQDGLLARLHLDHGAATADPHAGSRYFYDLHLIMRLVRGSWPFAAQFAPPHIDLDTIDDHVGRLRHETTTNRAAGEPARNQALRGGPPHDPHTCAHLLAFAGHLRAQSDALGALVSSVDGGTPWTRHLETFLRRCSAAVQTVAGSVVQEQLPNNHTGRRGTARPRRAQPRGPG
ncbi:hypothetical protein [Amycolatopsis circi]|uniref:hypothetical protein n=1 Tax=Amycolatopsis circi TaxID=871959 RepID=UPI000E269485|nr:hypothetical protein [Amycolatopsis circi]